MNKKIILTSLAVLAIALTSCKKCQTCTTTTVQSYNGTEVSTSTDQEYCGNDYDNAPAEGTTYQSAQGATQAVTIDCVDK